MIKLPGGMEWIIILVIVLLLFGVGRISKISGEMGTAIKNFRKGLQDDDAKKTEEKIEVKPIESSEEEKK
jgi:sec-independent protein translocase protein TatA